MHLMTPPPKEDNVYIKSVINRYRAKMVGEYDIQVAEVRLKLWDIEMEALQIVCGEYGINVV